MLTTLKHQNKRGQAAVEFALIMIVLTALVFGILEVSRLVFINSEIENAAREGAQYAALHSDVDNAALLSVVRSKLALADRSAVTVVGPTYPGGLRCAYCQVQVSVSYNWTTLVQISNLGTINLQSSSTKFVEVP